MRFKAFFAGLLLISILSSANAVDLLDNSSSSVSTSSIASISGGFQYGFVFTTGATGYNLNDLSVVPLATTSQVGNFTVSLYATSGNFPSGSALAAETFTGIQFSQLSSASTSNAVTLTFTQPFTLQTSTTYALIATSNVTSSGMGMTTPVALPATGSSGLSYIGTLSSIDSGTSWFGPFTTPQAWVKLTGTSVVPEPSTYALAAISAGVLAVMARRRKRQILVS